MSWYCDSDGPAVYSEQEVVARKEHGCVECAAAITKGERHLRYSGLWDGQWDNGRQHLLCRDACVWVRDAILEGECLPFGGLSEFWEDTRGWGDLACGSYGNRPNTKDYWLPRWKRGARMYAMVRRRVQLDRMAS